MKIGICGGTGLIGKVLTEELIHKGHEVVIFTRKKDILLEFTNFIKPFTNLIRQTDKSISDSLQQSSSLEIVSNSPPTPDDISGLDGIINLVGEPILGTRWSEQHKQRLRKSRVDYTNQLVSSIQNSNPKPKFFFSASAIGYYGMWEESSIAFDEEFPNGSDFLAKLCLDWEEEALKASETCRVIIGRIGIVLTSKGGALAQMLPVFKAFLGGQVASGKQYMSWIHIQDIVQAIFFLLENPNFQGVFNLTAPNPVTNREFSETLAKVLKRPCLFSVPSFALELLYGMGAEVVTKGQRVQPKRLLDSKFEFQFPNLEHALQDLISKEK